MHEPRCQACDGTGRVVCRIGEFHHVAPPEVYVGGGCIETDCTECGEN